MSLTAFIKIRDVKNKLKPFRPPCPRKIGVPIKVERRTTKDHVSSICTAFDYLVRFELERRCPHLISQGQWSDGRWIAEYAPVGIKSLMLVWGNIEDIERKIGRYYLLANHFPGSEHVPLEELSITKINRVGIYYGRHGHLWSLNTSFWTEQPEFLKLKKWFFERANEIRVRRKEAIRRRRIAIGK